MLFATAIIEGHISIDSWNQSTTGILDANQNHLAKRVGENSQLVGGARFQSVSRFGYHFSAPGPMNQQVWFTNTFDWMRALCRAGKVFDDAGAGCDCRGSRSIGPVDLRRALADRGAIGARSSRAGATS